MPEPEGELFHADWEPRALALTLAMGATGSWNIDMSRAARETLPDYARLELLPDLDRRAGEAAGRTRPGAARRTGRRPRAASAGAGGARAARRRRGRRAGQGLAHRTRRGRTPARFSLGDRVRTRSQRVAHHTRLPGYAHGKHGVVESVHGAHVFADAPRAGPGRAAAVAVPRGLQRRRTVGRRRRARPAACRSTPGKATWKPAAHDTPRCCPACRRTAANRCSPNPGRRRPSRWPWRCTSAACSAGPNGPRRCRRQIAAAQAAGDADLGDTYYRHWLAALETLVAAKGASTADELARYPRRLGPRRRPHAARPADRAASPRTSQRPERSLAKASAMAEPACDAARPHPFAARGRLEAAVGRLRAPASRPASSSARCACAPGPPRARAP